MKNSTLNLAGMAQAQLSALYLESVGYDPFAKEDAGATRQEIVNTLAEFERMGELRKPKTFLEFALKGIQYSARMSEETFCFSAFLYINGKKVADVHNDGHGGATSIRGITSEDYKLIRSAEEYCKTLPEHVFSDERLGGSIPMDLEMLVNDMLGAFLMRKDEEKAQRKMEKLMNTHIVAGKKDGGWFQGFRTWKLKVPMSVLSHYPDQLKTTLDNIRKQLKEGEEILNNNISVNPKVN